MTHHFIAPVLQRLQRLGLQETAHARSGAWRRKARTQRLNLALQGGGAHGAFTWGVLDALLEDGRLDFEGISGSSAGAMNAAVMAQGWVRGGRDGARAALSRFWSAIGQMVPAALMAQGSGEDMRLSPTGKLLVSWSTQFSPAQLNPMAMNVLRELLLEMVDFNDLRQHCPFKLFIGATQANTGRLRVFREHELTVDMLLASACLPRLHHPVEIDGQPYWDGGYSANPAVFPLFYECDSPDVLLVLLNPLEREGTPHTSIEIRERISELGFHAHFMREMQLFTRAMASAAPSFVSSGPLERKLRAMRFHMIEPGQCASMRRPETRLLAHMPYLQLLHDQGREHAAAWLTNHAQDVGKRSSIDMEDCFA
ncbi:patatin-like phospholipase family protein [Azohydromonas lata]|uniref:Patatin-like phospholipase family protein n=1 Tax=Azohydromonas lata TaxID=45677 RepID=A0ABU5IAE7_9BURK|nr:patatin-like phospholipase family protein [Azohydromonas lata]MDZ5455625.1 patatin-like phospholipase family protein [Azohydromonas lata]